MEDFPTCISALKRGDVNAVSTDDIILAGFASADPELTLVGGQFTREPYGVAVPKGQKDFAMFINAVINQMLEDGRWGKLYYQYLGDIPGLASIKDAKARLPFGVDD
jgi:ABC-type amino acid transport substrate-binding protein